MILSHQRELITKMSFVIMYILVAGYLKMPNGEEARGFAVETVLHEPTLALHKSWPWATEEEMKQLMRTYNKKVLDSRTPPVNVKTQS